MPTTTAWGLPYFVGSDVPAGMDQQRQLAEAVDVALTRKYFNMWRDTDQTVGVDGDVAVALNAELDPYAMCSAGQFVVPHDGLFAFTWGVQIAFSGTAPSAFSVYSSLWRDAAEARRGTHTHTAGAGWVAVGTNGTALGVVTAGQTFSLHVYVSAPAATKTIVGSGVATFLDGVYLTPEPA